MGTPSIEQNVSKSLVSELRSRSSNERALFETLHHELRRIARAKMRKERVDHTLQATALVNEAFLKIHKTGLPIECWTDPVRASRVIAHAMEQILNDHADRHKANKRGGSSRQRVPLDETQARELASDPDSPLALDSELMIAPDRYEELLSVRSLLDSLKKDSPRSAEILRLQFYCSMTQEEIAELLDISVETVKLETRKAKAFMKVALESKSN
jgi:RNA polymerase sigma factor (sigma-70 family)